MQVRRGVGGCRGAATVLVLGLAGLSAGPARADAAVPHVVAPGETLWSISAANNLTTRTVAVFNGLPEDAMVVEGQTVNVPTVEEGAAALAAAGVTVPTAGAGSSAAGLGHVPSPYGELHLDPAAADSWNAMREDSVANHGVDLYPAGTVSAYRTYEQQAELYDLYLSGQGAPANPPGTSTHETGTAVDVPDPAMRHVIDHIGSAYGWSGTIPSEWWHVQHGW